MPVTVEHVDADPESAWAEVTYSHDIKKFVVKWHYAQGDEDLVFEE